MYFIYYLEETAIFEPDFNRNPVIIVFYKQPTVKVVIISV